MTLLTPKKKVFVIKLQGEGVSEIDFLDIDNSGGGISVGGVIVDGRAIWFGDDRTDMAKNEDERTERTIESEKKDGSRYHNGIEKNIHCVE